MENRKKHKHVDEEREHLVVSLRSDLYRAFRRCAWMLIHETGMTPHEAHDKIFEALLKKHEC